MSRRITIAILVLTLMAGSSTLGGIIQDQGYAIGTDNLIHLTQGDQSAQSSQDLVIDMSQSAEGSGLAIVTAYAYGGLSSQTGGPLGALGLIGAGSQHVISVGTLGTSIITPTLPSSAGSATLNLAQARMNALLLMAD